MCIRDRYGKQAVPYQIHTVFSLTFRVWQHNLCAKGQAGIADAVSYTHLDVYKRQAVPFASGATSSHGLRLYGSIIITIERSWRQLCGKLLMERWQESLSGIIPPLVGYGVPAQRLSFYRNVFGCFMLR